MRAAKPCRLLRSALTEANYVALAAPLTQGTQGMGDASVVAAVNPGARLINAGRRGLVDEVLVAHRGVVPRCWTVAARRTPTPWTAAPVQCCRSPW
ncbi:NAD(P)-dependent oxidoreductase [Streptomyces canus]|uniref:NAD(P)-dependent oxidoreductase n=1 Tax=Streptomyces canus TaxID=58343 RepID=UPI0033F3CED8